MEALVSLTGLAVADQVRAPRQETRPGLDIAQCCEDAWAQHPRLRAIQQRSVRFRTQMSFSAAVHITSAHSSHGTPAGADSK